MLSIIRDCPYNPSTFAIAERLGEMRFSCVVLPAPVIINIHKRIRKWSMCGLR
jgi:hypothetical protein